MVGRWAHPSQGVAMLIPSMLLKKLYTLGSLKNAAPGVQFAVKNRLSDAELTGLRSIAIDGRSIALSEVTLELADGKTLNPDQISAASPIAFPLRATVLLQTRLAPLPLGLHEIEIAFETRPFGKLQFKVEDTISEHEVQGIRIPRDASDDYGDAVIKQRQALVEQVTNTKSEHIWK
jgi:hydroxymethylglutaryl-CoA reductase (NADPH)